MHLGRQGEINRNITAGKYEKLFGGLSEIQRKIIDDDHSRYIVAAAGPGSGKTRVLVHKLASLLMLEDVKHEQLLMLTFSRAKSFLSIHTDSAFFDRFHFPFIRHCQDREDYPEPKEIILELGHRDVALGTFRQNQASMEYLQSGDTLVLQGSTLMAGNPHPAAIGRLSKACMERLSRFMQKGYRVTGLRVRFLVWWKGRDDEQEIRIPLPDLSLKKTEQRK